MSIIARSLHECNFGDKWHTWEAAAKVRMNDGIAIDHCYEDEDGRLWVANDEYGNQVNFCPFCGYKAPTQIET